MTIADSRNLQVRPLNGLSKAIGLLLYPKLNACLEAWIADQPEPKPSRPEVIRHARTDWLPGQGYVRHREDPEGAN